MTIKYLDSKRIVTSPTPSKSWEFADGKATGSFQLLPAGTTAFTLMAWVKFKDFSSNHEILRSGNANDSIEIWTSSSGLYLTSSSWNGNAYSTQLVTTANLSTTSWTHIAVCRDGSERDFIYINGEPASKTPSGRSKSVPTISDWHIGGRHDNSEDFDGDISQWLVYTDYKSQVEVKAVYNSGSGTLTPSTTNLQTHYNFAQTGTTLTDQQGSNNCTASGTIVTGKSGFGDVQAKPSGEEVVLSRQGNDGGIGVPNFSGSGGGGSATAGFVNGGDGTANDITGASPTPYYSGGGGGGNGQNFNSAGTGGSSIGGNGGYNSVGANATANRGSGGGGGGNNASAGYAGGNGSNGVVIIRYTTADGSPNTSGSVTSDTSISGQTILTYTGTGTFVPTSSFNVRYLVIGAGAGGGGDQAGGGGAGGYLSSSSYAVTAQSYSITVGSGGAGGSAGGSSPANGGDSSFGTITSTGGGKGGTGSADASNGGSGGGMSADSLSVTGLGTKVTTTSSVQDNSILVEKDTSKRYWFNIPDFDLSELKAYYKFDETTGNILNKSTSIGSTVAVASSDLVVTGATRGVTGKLDKALSFDGSGDYVQATSAGYTGFNFMHQNGATFTVLSWYKVDAFTAGTNLIGTEQVSGSESGFLFALRHDDRKWDIFIGQTNSDLIDFSNSVQTPNDTDWHMLMVQYNDATGTVSVSIDNGTVATSTGHNLTNTSNQTNYFIMGADGALNGSWNGDIDETSIWNRVLTTAEITTIYNSGTGKTLDTAKGVGKWTYEYALPTISGLKLHLDASDASTITKDGSNLVSAWNDKSGEGNHISQSTGSKQPLWVDNTQNGLPLIRFDGSNDQLNRSTFVNGAISQGFYMFVVMKPTSGSASSPYNFDGGSGARGWCYTASGNTVRYGAGIEQVVDPNLPSTPAMYTFFIDGNSSDVRKNSVSTASGTFGSSTINGLWLACRHSDASFGSPDHAEILFYDNDIGTTNRDAVEAYLKKKWGL